jgi:hypothetical protein
LQQQYAEQRLDVSDIAAQLGCHPDTVQPTLVAAGIPGGGPECPSIV